ncbi:hypothetical protein V8C86DRAFT_2855179, partial [Haematococcus lacustris]
SVRLLAKLVSSLLPTASTVLMSFEKRGTSLRRAWRAGYAASTCSTASLGRARSPGGGKPRQRCRNRLRSARLGMMATSAGIPRHYGSVYAACFAA